MKITFILRNADMAGGVRVVATYAQRLARRGHEVLAVSAPWPRYKLTDQVKTLVRKGRWPGNRAIRKSHLDLMGVKQRIIERYRPIEDRDVPDGDVVVATWWETAEWVAGLSASKGAKAYFIQHYETWGAQGQAERVDATWRLGMRKIVISHWLADLAKEKFGDGDVSHVPNSVDMELFHAARRGKQKRPTVGFLYSPVPFKGCDVTLKAIELARKEIPELAVAAFGMYEESGAFPLPAGTEYMRQPAQERIRDIYGRCDAWLCGSRSEGFHLPPLEAMACRCPVVSTRVGGPMDVIEEGVNGHLVEVEDPAALAERLVRVLRLSEEAWGKMSEAALATAERYTWEDATDLFEAALRKAAERGHGGGGICR